MHNLFDYLASENTFSEDVSNYCLTRGKESNSCLGDNWVDILELKMGIQF